MHNYIRGHAAIHILSHQLDDEPLQIAYKKKFEFWYGIELSRRIVAVLLITVYPEKSVRQLLN